MTDCAGPAPVRLAFRRHPEPVRYSRALLGPIDAKDPVATISRGQRGPVPTGPPEPELDDAVFAGSTALLGVGMGLLAAQLGNVAADVLARAVARGVYHATNYEGMTGKTWREL